MKRKYNCQKVRTGDWVYICDCGYESKCKYKVLAIEGLRKIIVEVKDNDEDSKTIKGWLTDSNMYEKKRYNLPSGIMAWIVVEWSKAERKCLNIE